MVQFGDDVADLRKDVIVTFVCLGRKSQSCDRLMTIQYDALDFRSAQINAPAALTAHSQHVDTPIPVSIHTIQLGTTIIDMPIAIGTPAPDFTLKTLGAEGLVEVTLSSHFGKDNVVLLFVPGAFTNVCTQELCEVSQGLHPLSNAIVYGISVDSAFCQAAWAKAEHISIPLLSDFEHKVTQAYGVVLESLAGLGPASARASIVIDATGTVRYVEVTATPGELPDFEALIAAVGSL